MSRSNEEPSESRTSILLVDDDPDIRRFIEVNLVSTCRYSVTHAEDGQEALDRVAKGTFDLILTGVMMPRMDGFTLVERLRARPDTSDTPIIICSGRHTPADVERGLALGADDFIAKPFDPIDMVARVRAALRRPGSTSRVAQAARQAAQPVDVTRFYGATGPPESPR
jgi:DNA-binding response OmpR family regulator